MYDGAYGAQAKTETQQHKNNQSKKTQTKHKPNTHNQTKNHRQHRGETWKWNGPNALSTSPPPYSPITANK